MGALSDLLSFGSAKGCESCESCELPSAGVGDSQHSQDSQGVTPKIRAHLLALAEDELVDVAHVHRLSADDVAALEGLPDATLRAYLHARVRDAGMDAGIVPQGWTAVGHCRGCGPVHLWAPIRLAACPWCFRRRAGKAIPRPMVACGDCRHYAADPLNREAGIGTCNGGLAARWPMQLHRCEAMRPSR